MRAPDTEALWQEDEHHGHHQEGEDDLHGILQESDHIAHQHAGFRHLVRTDPNDQQR